MDGERRRSDALTSPLLVALLGVDSEGRQAKLDAWISTRIAWRGSSRSARSRPRPWTAWGAAVFVVEDLRAQSDHLLDRFVAQARQEGSSWTEIGETLGISKQAAHQRFVAAEQPSGGWPAHATDLVRAAMVTAEHESRRMGHNHLGTEHVLLGLLAEPDGVAALALAALGVDRAGVLARITGLIGTGPERRWEALCEALLGDRPLACQVVGPPLHEHRARSARAGRRQRQPGRSDSARPRRAPRSGA